MPTAVTSARSRAAVAFVLTALLSLIVLGAPASAQAKRFGTYAACNPARQQADPDRTCHQGDLLGAVFRAFRSDHVHYRVCMREPDGRKRCKNKETRGRGVRSRAGFIPRSDRLGIYVFTWKIRGELVDRDRIRLASEGV